MLQANMFKTQLITLSDRWLEEMLGVHYNLARYLGQI